MVHASITRGTFSLWNGSRWDALPNSAGSDSTPVVVLGLGFTTQRLARRLLLRGSAVYASVRRPERFRDLESIGVRFGPVPRGCVLVHSVPPLADDETAELRRTIGEIRPRRVVYISSTGVYGRTAEVDAETPVDGYDSKARRRIAEEDWIASGDWSTTILRAAAIYGPGRGVHCRIARGEAPRASGAGYVSRIHVDDLAALLEAAAGSDFEGRRPVADEHPCSSDEINAFCARLLGRDCLAGDSRDGAAGRRVDGRAIREELGVSLAYPDYQSGILASLAEGETKQPSRRMQGS